MHPIIIKAQRFKINHNKQFKNKKMNIFNYKKNIMNLKKDPIQ